MRLGIMHHILGASDLGEAFSRAAAIGAAGVEIMYGNSAEALMLAAPGHPSELKALSARHSLAIPSICLGFLCGQRSLIGPPLAVAAAHEQIRHAIGAAGEAGIGIVLVPFFGRNAIELESELNVAAESLQAVVEMAEEAGVVVGIESNLNLQQQQSLLHTLGSSDNAKIYYDTGNALARRLDVVTCLRDLGGRSVAQVHIKDVKMAEGAPPDFSVPLGKGDVDFPAVIQALRAMSYDGWLVLETPAGDDALASARANMDYARKLLGQ